ncbi:serine hydrolase [Paenibacillus nanensis]|nr:serine hydrolase [Paenibacillus nanensis]
MKWKQLTAGVIAVTTLVHPGVVMAKENVVQEDRLLVTTINAQKVKAFLDRFFHSEAVKREASAVSVSIVKDGFVLAEEGYGVTDKASGQHVDASDTTFRVGSVSKVFTVIALMQLVDQGKVSLDDNIEKFLDGYKIRNPFGTPVTVEMLLTHSTGFEVRDPTEENVLFDPAKQPITLKESVFSIFPPVIREPGTSYMYDNFATQLVGYIVQEVSGEPFSDYMDKHIFAPLGMASSSFDPSGELSSRLPVTYSADDERLPEYRLSPEVLPEGSMMTTAADMSRFMNAYLNGGKTSDGKAILSSASLQAMSTFHLSIHPEVPDMAYGFEAPAPLSAANGKDVIAKGGSIPGFESYMFMLPNEKTAVFISAATESDLTLRFFEAFMDEFYPGDASFGDPAYKPQKQEQLRRFEGIYRDLRISFMLTSIKASADGVLLVGDTAGEWKTMKQIGELLFVDEEGHPLAFEEDANGRIVYVKYSNPGSYAAKLPEGPRYADVPSDHPYAAYIYGLQSLGVSAGESEGRFGTEELVTREMFIHHLIRQFNLPLSTQTPAFNDVADSSYKEEIQTAAELQLVTGTGNGRFEPHRTITREEAAVIVLRLLQISGYQPKESETELVPGTSQWAEQAVKTLIDLRIHGIEVTKEKSQYNYGSKRALTKQELAAIQYLLMLPEKSLLS